MTGSRKPINANYSLHVDISSGLPWSSRIDWVTSNATITLNFVRRNVKTKHPRVREMVLIIIIHLPGQHLLEFTAAVMNPYKKRDLQVEKSKVLRRAARWVSCNYERLASVSDMIAILVWRSLEQSLFYNIIHVHGLVAVPFPVYIQPNTYLYFSMLPLYDISTKYFKLSSVFGLSTRQLTSLLDWNGDIGRKLTFKENNDIFACIFTKQWIFFFFFLSRMEMRPSYLINSFIFICRLS